MVGTFREGLGRLGFACGPLLYLRAFLGPLYVWAAVASPTAYADLPLFVLVVVKWLKDEPDSYTQLPLPTKA